MHGEIRITRYTSEHYFCLVITALRVPAPYTGQFTQSQVSIPCPRGCRSASGHLEPFQHVRIHDIDSQLQVDDLQKPTKGESVIARLQRMVARGIVAKKEVVEQAVLVSSG